MLGALPHVYSSKKTPPKRAAHLVWRQRHAYGAMLQNTAGWLRYLRSMHGRKEQERQQLRRKLAEAITEYCEATSGVRSLMAGAIQRGDLLMAAEVAESLARDRLMAVRCRMHQLDSDFESCDFESLPTG